MRTMLFKNKEKVLAIITGILFFGMIVNTINSESALNIVQKDSAAYIPEDNVVEETADNIEEKVIEDKIDPELTIDPEQIEQVKNYLSNRNSPLAEYADVLVTAAYEYGIDYRLVAAISVIESEGGKHCFKPYNAWGWGSKSFESWRDGIYTVTEGLSKYYANGLTTPALIAPVYCPPNASKWASNVQYVMNQIAEN
jgi:hypothetical protein